jgi:hypothetical protein
MPVQWDQKAFVKQVRERLVERMDLVGKVVETRARERLLAIEKPKSGGPYRREIVARRLTHTVTVEEKAVTTTVGVRLGTKPVKGAETIGLYIEIGSRKRGAANYLRQSVFGDAKQIVDLLSRKM